MNAPDPTLSLDPLASLEQAAALAVPGEPGPPPPNREGSDRDLAPQVEQVKSCLRLLERVWPRSDAGHAGSQTGDRISTHAAGNRGDSYEPPFQVPGFAILEEINRGGMGIVYRARQLSVDREVALKWLPPAYAADPERLERFHVEATAVARLQAFGVLPLHDVLQADGTPILVMPFIDGPDLGRVLAQRQALRAGQEVPDPHPLATADERSYLERVLTLLDRLIDAAAATHAAGILHRDIKPSNILLDARDNAWLSDFGLAKLRDNPRITATGAWMGTPGFISPEQWEGRSDLDARADLFSLAATIYQALTLRLPYGHAWLKADTALPTPPRRLQPLLSADFDAVLLKALEPDRKHRYGSMAEFKEDWQRVRQGLPPRARRLGPARRLLRRARRNPWMVAACFLAAALLGVVGFLPRSGGPEMVDPTVRQTLRISTDPPGARVVLVPFNQYGELDPDRRVKPAAGQKTPLKLQRVPAGKYLVVAEVPGYGFHEVYRTVPESAEAMYDHSEPEQTLATRLDDGSLEWPLIRIVANEEAQKDMARFSGGEMELGGAEIKQRSPSRHISPFFLDTTEVTVQSFKRVEPDLTRGLEQRYPELLPDYAIRGVTFAQALDFAEKVGKRLPTEAEYEFAATNGGTQRFPWGNEEKPGPWVLGPVGKPEYDRTNTCPPVFGLYSNVAEWTDSLLTPYAPRLHPSVKKYPDKDYMTMYLNCRVIRGAPNFIIKGTAPKQGHVADSVIGPTWRQSDLRTIQLPGVGFRCARSVAPRFLDD